MNDDQLFLGVYNYQVSSPMSNVTSGSKEAHTTSHDHADIMSKVAADKVKSVGIKTGVHHGDTVATC